MYFAIYQAIAKDENRPGLYKEYSQDFFDLIIVDECHRGSAKDESNWREILRYFEPAFQLGMTATPLAERQPRHLSLLRQSDLHLQFAPGHRRRISRALSRAPHRDGVGRGRLASEPRRARPLRPRRSRTTNIRPKDFERAVALKARTEAIARNLTDFLKKTDRFAKTIVFCVDQEHADEMRRALNNLNADLVKQYPDYVCRVTSDEGDVGKGHLSKFQELETVTPVILTTSQLLTTGVDVPTCKNIVIARVVGSMMEFKQIIGRGTRVRDDYGKLYFNILDYTGSATRLFADPDFDGEPAFVTEQEMNDNGRSHFSDCPDGYGDRRAKTIEMPPDDLRRLGRRDGENFISTAGRSRSPRTWFTSSIRTGDNCASCKFSEYAAEKVRTIYPSAADLRQTVGRSRAAR